MTDISAFTTEELSGTSIGPSHGVAKDRLNAIIAKLNAADPVHQIQDHVRAKCVGLDANTDEDEVSAALDGDADDYFVPTHLVFIVTDESGTIAADGTVNIGTTTGGTEIASAEALTGLDDVGDMRMVTLADTVMAAVAGNATVYANVESDDTTATTLVLDVYVLGRTFTP